jgi:hypothetical protein
MDRRWFLAALWLAFPPALHADPFILVADSGASQFGQISLFRQYDPSGVETGRVTNPAFSFPTILAADSAGTSFVTNINFIPAQRYPDIIRVDLSGNILARNSAVNLVGPVGGELSFTINSGHGTYLATSNNPTLLVEFDSNLQLLRQIPTGQTFGPGIRIVGIAISPDLSKILVADQDGQSGHGFLRIYDYTTGNQLGQIHNPALAYPVDLKYGPGGLLYVTDRGSTQLEDNILVFDSSFNLIREFTSGAPVHYNFGSFDILPNGNLVLIEPDFPVDKPIRILTNTGQFVTEFGEEINQAEAITVVAGPGGPTPGTIPEPTTFSLMLVGVFVLLLVNRRMNRRSTCCPIR